MNKDFLAFVHLKKNAGTTLIHILRLNFFMRHCDVKILSKTSDSIFQAEDMKKVLTLNPLIKSIAGHSVKPYGSLYRTYPRIRFITLLRDPVQRYISQYQYNVEKLGADLSFDDYLQDKFSFNKQTRAIAGSEDIVLAKNILSERFFLVGIVEEFDEFLILLKKKLEPIKFRPGYKVQNIAKKGSQIGKHLEEQQNKYLDQIIERNLLDMELYDYCKNEILTKEKKEYGPTYEYDAEKFKGRNKNFPRNFLRYLDYACRKCYYESTFAFIRKFNGLE